VTPSVSPDGRADRGGLRLFLVQSFLAGFCPASSRGVSLREKDLGSAASFFELRIPISRPRTMETGFLPTFFHMLKGAPGSHLCQSNGAAKFPRFPHVSCEWRLLKNPFCDRLCLHHSIAPALEG